MFWYHWNNVDVISSSVVWMSAVLCSVIATQVSDVIVVVLCKSTFALILLFYLRVMTIRGSVLEVPHSFDINVTILLLGSIWCWWICRTFGMEDHWWYKKCGKLWSTEPSFCVWENNQRFERDECKCDETGRTVGDRMQWWRESSLATCCKASWT